MVQSKAKGNKWENDVLRDIRKFYRDAYKALGSGNAKDDKGDILYRDYMLECKHHKKLTRGELNKYWTKLMIEADKARRIPVLVFKENGKDPMIWTWGTTIGSKQGPVKLVQYYDEWLLHRKLDEEECYGKAQA